MLHDISYAGGGVGRRQCTDEGVDERQVSLDRLLVLRLLRVEQPLHLLLGLFRVTHLSMAKDMVQISTRVNNSILE